MMANTAEALLTKSRIEEKRVLNFAANERQKIVSYRSNAKLNTSCALLVDSSLLYLGKL